MSILQINKTTRFLIQDLLSSSLHGFSDPWREGWSSNRDRWDGSHQYIMGFELKTEKKGNNKKCNRRKCMSSFHLFFWIYGWFLHLWRDSYFLVFYWRYLYLYIFIYLSIDLFHTASFQMIASALNLLLFAVLFDLGWTLHFESWCDIRFYQ